MTTCREVTLFVSVGYRLIDQSKAPPIRVVARKRLPTLTLFWPEYDMVRIWYSCLLMQCYRSASCHAIQLRCYARVTTPPK